MTVTCLSTEVGTDSTVSVVSILVRAAPAQSLRSLLPAVHEDFYTSGYYDPSGGYYMDMDSYIQVLSVPYYYDRLERTYELTVPNELDIPTSGLSNVGHKIYSM